MRTIPAAERQARLKLCLRATASEVDVCSIRGCRDLQIGGCRDLQIGFVAYLIITSRLELLTSSIYFISLILWAHLASLTGTQVSPATWWPYVPIAGAISKFS